MVILLFRQLHQEHAMRTEGSDKGIGAITIYTHLFKNTPLAVVLREVTTSLTRYSVA